MYDDILNKLERSKFRSSFKLTSKDLDYINNKGLETIKNHAQDFILKRLAPYPTKNDGKQTPFKGHPVFIAEHATATCCRKCLAKWHKIKPDKELTKEEQDYIIKIIMAWITRQITKNNIKK